MDYGKSVLNILLTVILFTGFTAGIQAATGIMGDVNDDGVVDIVDALRVANACVSAPLPVDFNQEQADVNLSGNIDIVDALLIAQFTVGVIAALPYLPCYALKVDSLKGTVIYPQQACYPPGTRVLVSAPLEYHAQPPLPGVIIIGGDFYFSHWEDDEGNTLSTNAAFEIIMNSNLTVHAIYDQIW